ncbi:hypothetical protein CVT26_007231 [Gymnopilus dilepis]|uniref:Uncharacterized protein n=1 Tax=Gymnopilus dilepis TaxID=231916 RepID=A0A409VMH3_9AGAR|nr:hypothetical protein CVT26_007231 [Gymnopilus dilepis]
MGEKDRNFDPTVATSRLGSLAAHGILRKATRLLGGCSNISRERALLPSDICTSSGGVKEESSARRFANFIRDEPEIVNYIESMTIDHEKQSKNFAGVPAIQDSCPANAKERAAFCLILSRSYSNLRLLMLPIFQHLFLQELPADVSDALHTIVARPSLTEVSVMAGAIYPKFFYQLQKIDTINMCSMNIRGNTSESHAVKRCSPRTLRVLGLCTLRELLPQDRVHPIGLERLTTLHIHVYDRTLADFIPWSFSACASKLIDLKMFVAPWDGSRWFRVMA